MTDLQTIRKRCHAKALGFVMDHLSAAERQAAHEWLHGTAKGQTKLARQQAHDKRQTELDMALRDADLDKPVRALALAEARVVECKVLAEFFADEDESGILQDLVNARDQAREGMAALLARRTALIEERDKLQDPDVEPEPDDSEEWQAYTAAKVMMDEVQKEWVEARLNAQT